MKNFKFIFIAILLFFFVPCKSQDIVNVVDFGAKGNGNTDDWTSIQKSIDYAINNKIKTVYFPKGKYLIRDKSIIVWGSNIILKGEEKNKTIIYRVGRPGWWGETIHISGLLPGGKYYGGFGKLDSYNSFVLYKGERKSSNNIELTNLTIDSDISYPQQSNNIGITNTKDVNINNCIIKNAPQSNIAIVNDTYKASNSSVIVNDCLLENSGQHNMRVISYNQGKIIGNTVVVNNTNFKNVRFKDLNKEIINKKIHLWYRAGLGGENISLVVNNCNFDNTGDIITTVNSNNLVIKNSKIADKIFITNNTLNSKSNVLLENNIFYNNMVESIINKNAKPILKNNIKNNGD